MNTSRKSIIPFLLLALVFLISLACGSSTTDTPTAPETTEEEQVATSGDETQPESPAEPTNTPEPTDTPEPTPLPPTPTSAPIGLSRSLPFAITELVSAPNWDIQVLETVRGDAAWQAIQSANQFNEPAAEGMEYLLVKIHAKCTYADSEEHSISGADFKVTGDRLIVYTQSYVVDPEPSLDAQLYAEGEAEGWVSFAVGQGEGNLMLIVDELMNWDDDRYRFIALDEGASISVAQDLAGITATDLGEDRGSPAPLGETIITENWKVTILEVVRGEGAWAMAQEANMFNEAPAEGMEYVAFKVHVQYIGTDDKAENISRIFFNTTGSANVVYEDPFLVAPEPGLDAYLYPGGETEGWAILQVAIDETNIMVIFEPIFAFTDADKRFMSLEP